MKRLTFLIVFTIFFFLCSLFEEDVGFLLKFGFHKD